jgi:hypothetical protein
MFLFGQLSSQATCAGADHGTASQLQPHTLRSWQSCASLQPPATGAASSVGDGGGCGGGVGGRVESVQQPASAIRNAQRITGRSYP